MVAVEKVVDWEDFFSNDPYGHFLDHSITFVSDHCSVGIGAGQRAWQSQGHWPRGCLGFGSAQGSAGSDRLYMGCWSWQLTIICPWPVRWSLPSHWWCLVQQPISGNPLLETLRGIAFMWDTVHPCLNIWAWINSLSYIPHAVKH